MEEFGEKILALISKKTGKPVTANDTFDSLQLDSVAMAELSYEVEQLVGVRADEGVLDCETVAELIDYVWELKKRHAPPG
jgi:acyl carrier protein